LIIASCNIHQSLVDYSRTSPSLKIIVAVRWFGHGLLFMKRGKLTVSTRIASGKRTAADKMAALEVADVTVVKNPAEIGDAVQTILG
jgi:hypothetical protein